MSNRPPAEGGKGAADGLARRLRALQSAHWDDVADVFDDALARQGWEPSARAVVMSQLRALLESPELVSVEDPTWSAERKLEAREASRRRSNSYFAVELFKALARIFVLEERLQQMGEGAD